MANFSIVQFAKSTGSGAATFASPVTAGNTIVALFGENSNYVAGFTPPVPPSSVTDDNSPLTDVFLRYTPAWIVPGRPGQFSAVYVAINVAGGAQTVVFHGFSNNSNSSIILAEVAVPSTYFIFGVGGNANYLVVGGGVDQYGLNSADGVLTSFGISGPSGISGETVRTGLIGIELYGQNSFDTCENTAIAFGVPGSDIFLLVSGYDQNIWTSSGTIITQTIESDGAAFKLVLAYQDFPYLLGTGCSGGVPPFSISCNNPPIGSVGIPYSHEFPVLGGVYPLTFAITAGSLPPGLTLDTTTGIVSGTPTTPGAFWFTIEVTDADDNTASVTCAIAICPGGNANVLYYSRT